MSHVHRIFAGDDEVVSTSLRFLALTLPKIEWTHAGHFAVACWLLSTRPFDDVARDLPDRIRAYNVAAGVANTASAGYHETITQASLRAARDFLDRHADVGLAAACNALLQSPLGRSDWLLAYWTRERLFSADARARYCEPDIRALPF